MPAEVLHLYRAPGLTSASVASTERVLSAAGLPAFTLHTEVCFNVGAPAGKEAASDLLADARLAWLFRETFEPSQLAASSFLDATAAELAAAGGGAWLVEFGPRLSFRTAWSSNCSSILESAGVEGISRVEPSRRLLVQTGVALSEAQKAALVASLHDKMTEQVYAEPLPSFTLVAEAEPLRTVPIMSEGRPALEALNSTMGLGMDDTDLTYYHELFQRMGRDPTEVECFDMGQSNSEHSRHWFFKGLMVVDGEEMPGDLMEHVGATLTGPKTSKNGLINFHDNSSAITGYEVNTLQPETPGVPSGMQNESKTQHIIFTAETHNFPTGVAPRPGAETGIGGRLRDVQATGTGAHSCAGTAGYCVGSLHIPEYKLPWEDDSAAYPASMAPPLQIIVDASNGASEYGNCYGEPIVGGFTRSFGMKLGSGEHEERREWIKPIMFTGGMGRIDDKHLAKSEPTAAMLVIKVGGPAYRIGMGGGAASSKAGGEGEESSALDFNAVQRGDAEMEQKMNRIVRACIELGDANPIVSIHDQGAGGNSNVLKEIVEPTGGLFDIRKVLSGDPTLSALELWGAEFQENNGVLIMPESLELFTKMCARERCPFSVVGTVEASGRIVVKDSLTGETPVDLNLDDVLAKLPRKTFIDKRMPPLSSSSVTVPADVDVAGALDRVLRLLDVGSKRFLTTKVDRSVTGLIAQQQCVGPFHLPLSDVHVTALSFAGADGPASPPTGAAMACGEQPIKGLLDAGAGARMSVGESLTNLVWAPISALEDAKSSANWMWAAKLPGEGAMLWDAALAMKDVMVELGVGIQGGKDSLSMAASVEGDTVKAPGALVISMYAPCPDVSLVVTPDFKCAGDSDIIVVKMSKNVTGGKLGGSALGQCFNQLGNIDEVPDLDDSATFVAAFKTTQTLINGKKIKAGHDVSDGGLLTTVLEMAFAGGCGFSLKVDVAGEDVPMTWLFSEELGLVIEVASADTASVLAAYAEAGVPTQSIGKTSTGFEVKVDGKDDAVLLGSDVFTLRDTWEATGFELEKRQCRLEDTNAEQANLKARTAPAWKLSFEPPAPVAGPQPGAPKIAILREEGSNGDREMGGAFHAAGFEAWDITVSDIAGGRVTLEGFRGLALVGGFSFADTLDSAKGWAASCLFHETVKAQLKAFYERTDTFSLGVCNGCQLSALLGWVPFGPDAADAISGVETDDTAKAAGVSVSQPRFLHNASGRFESRFPTVTIGESPAIMLKGMEGSTLGVWLACGEGRAIFPHDALLEQVEAQGLAPIRFANDAGEPTEEYPFNPTGGPKGIAGLCSKDGRHLAMMPHPERCFLKWQLPYAPSSWADQSGSPWMQMFVNARVWCEEN